ncbi:hypothetical protein INT47_007923 [Mucor saturninus]|uniref:Uncharacterized protein n=1 Tax=Mucor saturninus TaxID=64648 RepID=A0A8H7QMD2_9FUNG|nr:hypothetical protein INT47_007923 [Mucor saturninus]
MRAFSTIFIAAVLALSANAAAVDKRAVSTAAALCIADLTSVSEQLTIVKTAVDAFVSSAGYSGATAIHDKGTELEARIVKATTDCNTITAPSNVEDTTAILANVGTLVPKVTGSLTSIVNKKSQFAAIPFATIIVKTDIKSLDTKTAALNAVLISKVPTTPTSYLDTANGYVAEINAGFSAAKTAYGI